MKKNNYFLHHSSIRFVAAMFLLYGSASFAQYKIDPKFEKEIKTKQQKLQPRVSGLNKESSLSMSTIITPDGQTKELYHAIVYTQKPQELRNTGILIQSVSKDFVTALLSIEDIEHLRTSNLISSVVAPTYERINNQANAIENGAALLHNGALNTSYTGKGVIVGIYDTGIDFTHPDFRLPEDSTKSRILSIWDQTLTARSGENPPDGFNYGVEYTQAQINDEIDGTPANFVREKDISGHGTHVAATAAGNGAALENRSETGMAPEADIVIVKGGDGSFPNTNTIASLDYFKKIAEKYNKPIVVNMSIGGHATPHDGTSPSEEKANEFATSGAGRAIVIAAGNEGTGKIHQRIEIDPKGKKSFTIDTGKILKENYQSPVFYFLAFTKGKNDTSDVTARLTAPDNSVYTQEAGSDGTYYLKDINDNNLIEMSLYNYVESTYGKRFIELDVYRDAITDTKGTYTLEIENNSDKAITLDGWLIYTNSTLASTVMTNGDNNYTIGSPGTAVEAITVANYIGKASFAVNNTEYPSLNGTYSASSYTIGDINPSSSIGPRADEVEKPDIAAGGTFVISAKSKDVADNYRIGKYYSQMSGTSMASPTVAGSVALLLQANKNLTATQIKQRIKESAKHDRYTTDLFSTKFGSGKLNIYKAVATEVNDLNNNSTCPISENTVLAYDDFYYLFNSTYIANLNYGSRRIAVKYTPNITGRLGSVAIYLGNYNDEASSEISLNVEIRKINKNGLPGDLMGSKTVPHIKSLEQSGWNNINVTDLGIDVNQNEDFYVVVYTNNPNLYIISDKKNIDNRTYLSSDQGATYTVLGSYDAKIRAVVYEDRPGIKQLATTARQSRQSVSLGYNYFISNCELITRVESSGSSPVSGNTTAKVWLDKINGNFISRRVEIQPEENSTLSTGKVTLFYSQEDFDEYNASNTIKLPTSPTDDANKANVLLYYYSGTSNDGSGTPKSYGTTPVVTNITADQIKWNSTYQYWEVTFDAIGFGGYMLSSDKTLSAASVELNALKIYPNPAKDVIHIDFPVSEQEIQVNIFDITGKAVLRNTLNRNSKAVDVSTLTTGAYIIEIVTSKGKVTKKLLKN